MEWVDTSCSVTGNSKEICTLRALATKALRVGRRVEEVAQEVLRSKSTNYILGAPKHLWG